jgi:hypothetical protein
LEGEVAEAAEEIIRENCKERDIGIITNFLEVRIKNKKNRKAFRYSKTNELGMSCIVLLCQMCI